MLPCQPSRPILSRLARLSSPSPALPSSLRAPVRMFALTPYRADQPRTLGHQKSLPRLPIPSLQSSFDRYLKSLKPLLLQQALEQGHNDADAYVASELAKRQKLVDDFSKQGGIGRVLQERLKDVDRSSPNNWLDDRFWLKGAYHSWRVPLVINSNWWILCADDPGIPQDFIRSAKPSGEFTDWQIKRAAKMAQRLVDFKLRLDRQEILPDSSRAGPFCMHQYTRVFGITRIPALPTDELVHSPHPHPANHVIVIVNDHFYKLDVIQDGQAVDLASLEARLWAIADDASSRSRGDGVGALSGNDRDSWTEAREHLLAFDPVNRQTITEIEDSLFVISLEDEAKMSESYKTSSPKSQTPDLEAHIRAASSNNGTGRNRWWDKAVAISIEPNGRASMIGEHSPCDALIPSIVCDYVLAEGTTAGTSQRGQNDLAPVRLDWKLDAKALDSIQAAQDAVAGLAKDSEGRMLWYDEYGIDWIKKTAKQSPDAYLQMALQLAYHKSQGKPTATYETASTRLFLHGRTDVIRTYSEDSWKWVQAMREGKESPQVLYELLTNATKAHNTYTRDSSVGKGCDRHMLGLKLLMREGESHPVFDDELFAKSQEWVLSTSGLSAGDRFYGTGFGTVWPNGYGINYLAGNHIIKFGIESKYSCKETSTDKFRENLVEAMREMRDVCLKAQGLEADAPKAKL